jgi:hypothetical protein
MTIANSRSAAGRMWRTPLPAGGAAVRIPNPESRRARLRVARGLRRDAGCSRLQAGSYTELVRGKAVAAACCANAQSPIPNPGSYKSTLARDLGTEAGRGAGVFRIALRWRSSQGMGGAARPSGTEVPSIAARRCAKAHPTKSGMSRWRWMRGATERVRLPMKSGVRSNPRRSDAPSPPIESRATRRAQGQLGGFAARE